MTAPVAYLLTGLPGSGKTTYARVLERQGVVRLSVDDEIARRHGRYGVDYPSSHHIAVMRPVVAELRREMAVLLRAGRSVVSDHGLGRRAEREVYKRLVERLGARWRLLHFVADHDELLRRLAARQRQPGPHPVTITPELLAQIAAGSQPPAGEGEEIVTAVSPDTGL